ncbi:MAG: deoxyribonuclease IV [Mollicutes bacterium PWAP]|nr:deoxyribonuclease IV [Mollicutes bacterium PWAP]
MNKLLIGSHVSNNSKNKYFEGVLNETLNNDASSMMFFLGSPQNSKLIDHELYKIDILKNTTLINKDNIIVHAPYIINPANPEKFNFAINHLIELSKRMNMFDAKHLVLHPGSHTNFKREDSIKTLINSLKEFFKRTENVEISIETMSGKGTEILTNLDEVIRVVKEVNNSRMKICLDTCHMHDSGIDMNKPNEVIKILEEKNIIPYVSVIHVNDSKFGLNSKKDRHANLKKGHIDFDNLMTFLSYEKFSNIPMILETPIKDNPNSHKEEIALIKNYF